MIIYLLTAVLWVTLERGDWTLVECSTSQPVQYFAGARLIRIDQCSDVIFSDGFE